MKATQLEQMREDFVHIKSTKSVTVDKVDQHSEVSVNQDTFSLYYIDLCCCTICTKIMNLLLFFIFEKVFERFEAGLLGKRRPLQELGISQ